ncbi:DUF4129 domain-containing protein [Salsuginibacillus kocurii]|uniref:DUF4129 domain-containing protein n=1 Tax=Salsuginibacillus kocurii TaxID=427078 RepID=UPI0003633585|nr:DUF4129 domain-containing protein [Salsuginibacillus kocurii]
MKNAPLLYQGLQLLFFSTLLYLVVWQLYAPAGLFAPVVPFKLLIAASFFAYQVGLKKLQQSWLLPLPPIVVFGLGLTAGMGWLETLLIVIASFAFQIAREEKESEDLEFLILFISLVLVIFSFLVYPYFPWPEAFFLYGLGQFILLLLVRGISTALLYSTTTKEALNQSKWTVSVSTGFIGLAVLLYGIWPAVLAVTQQITHLFLQGLYYLLLPLSYLVNFIISLQDEEAVEDQEEENNDSAGEAELFANIGDEPAGPPGALVWLIAALIIGAATYFLIRWLKRYAKRQRQEAPAKALASSARQTRSVSSSVTRQKKKRPWFHTDSMVRRKFAKVEAAYAAHGFSRDPSQSVEEWGEQSGKQVSKAATTVIALYSKVRYGGQTLTKAEEETYKQAVKQTLQDMKNYKRGA